jgi:hypothetical protein
MLLGNADQLLVAGKRDRELHVWRASPCNLGRAARAATPAILTISHPIRNQSNSRSRPSHSQPLPLAPEIPQALDHITEIYRDELVVRLPWQRRDKWVKLSQYTPEDELCKMLKTYNRQLSEYTKIKIMLKNNLISLLDQTFPGANELFSSPVRADDGHEKWVDFIACFWHCECISSLSQRSFVEKYKKWCHKNGYYFSADKAEKIHLTSAGHFRTLPKNDLQKR